MPVLHRGPRLTDILKVFPLICLAQDVARIVTYLGIRASANDEIAEALPGLSCQDKTEERQNETIGWQRPCDLELSRFILRSTLQ